MMSSAIRDHFNHSFLIKMPFVSLSYLIAPARISMTTLSRSGENEHTCLVPKEQEETFSTFHYLIMVLAVGRSYSPFFILRCIPSVPNCSYILS